MDNSQLALRKVMQIGVCLSFLLVITGGLCELYQHGHELINYGVFPLHSRITTSIPQVLISIGILVLVLTQVMRVVVAGWFFLRLRDYFFVSITVFILMIMLFNLIWHRM